MIRVTISASFTRSLAGAIAGILLSGCGSDPTDKVNSIAPPRTGFVFRQTESGTTLKKYAVFVPYTYEPSKRYPTLVFLHGLGEAGNDGRKELSQGLGPYIAKHPESFPYIVIFPQSDNDFSGDDRAQLVSTIIDEVQRDYSVDPDRITLTGVSTGGTGVWLVGARYADRFCALVPMCGYGDGDDVPTLAHLPIWIFHNSGDPFVLSIFSKRMYDKLQAAGANVQFTEYGSLAHDCWSRAYNEPKLWEWIADRHRQ